MTWPPNMRVVLGLADNPLVTCECGRTTNADMMLDVRSGPAAAFAGREWACDTCVMGAFRKKAMTREAFYRALGAPPALIARAALRDAADA